MTIFAFQIDAGDSESELEIAELRTLLRLNGVSYDDLIEDVALEVDGVWFTDVKVEKATGGYRLIFDIDDEVVIEPEEEIDVLLHVVFEPETSLNNARIQARVPEFTANAFELTGESGRIPKENISGSATGEWHSIVTAGPSIDLVNLSESVIIDDTETAILFTTEVDVTAYGQDVYVSNNAFWYGVHAEVNGSNAGKRVRGFDTTADEVGNGVYEIAEGETETFTLTLRFEPNNPGMYKARLTSFSYGTTETSPRSEKVQLPRNEFFSDSIFAR